MLNELFPQFTLADVLHKSPKTHVVVVRAADVQERFVVKASSRRPLSTRDIEIMQHEYMLLRSINSPNVVKAFEFATSGNVAGIRLEYVEGCDLEKLITVRTPGSSLRLLTVVDVLLIGHDIAKALAHIHCETRIIHGKVKPANIVYNFTAQRSVLVDFSAAHDITEPPTINEENVQMPSTDYHVDLVGLGMSLQTVLDVGMERGDTETDSDSGDAKARVVGLAPALYNAFNGVVKRLVELTGPRYHSARGVASDLAAIRRSKEAGNSSPELGEDDAPFFLAPPSTLYGHDEVTRTLVRRYRRCRDTSILQAVLVAGASGVGKTTVVRRFLVNTNARSSTMPSASFMSDNGNDDEVDEQDESTPDLDGGNQGGPLQDLRQLQGRPQSPQVAPLMLDSTRPCYQLSGTFGPSARSLVYSAFQQCFEQLADMLSALPRGELDTILWAIEQHCVGAFPELLMFAPALQPFFAPAQPKPKPPQDVAQCIRHGVAGVIAAFSSLGAPVVLFFDNLHLIDRASARLLKWLLESQTPMMFIGAYREEEGEASVELAPIIRHIQRRLHVRVNQVLPLTEEQVGLYVSSCLAQPPETLTELTHALFGWSHGTPIYIQRLLEVSMEQGMLRFDNKREKWTYDLPAMLSLHGGTVNPDFCSRFMQHLTPTTQRVLACAAVVGVRFRLAEVEHLCGPGVDVEAELLKARIIGNVSRDWLDYRFSSDLIYEAAMNTLTPAEQALLHFKIGCHLFKTVRISKCCSAAPNCQHMGQIAHAVVLHFLHCRELAAAWSEREGVAQLCLTVGADMRISGAYQDAEAVLALGYGMAQSEFAMEPNLRALRKQLLYLLMDVRILSGDLEKSYAILAEAKALAENMADIMDVGTMHLRLMRALQRNEDGYVCGLQLLRTMGLEVPTALTQDILTAAQTEALAAVTASVAWIRTSLDNLTHDPVRDTLVSACLDTSSFAHQISRPMESVWLICRGAIAALKQPGCRLAPTALAYFGFTLSWLPGIENALQQGSQLCLEAVQVAEASGDFVNLGHCSLRAGLACHFHTKPTTLLSYLDRAFHVAREGFDPPLIAFSAAVSMMACVHLGVRLDVVVERYHVYTESMRNVSAPDMQYITRVIGEYAGAFSNTALPPLLGPLDPPTGVMARAVYFKIRAFTHFLRREYSDALELLPDLEVTRSKSPGFSVYYDAVFVTALVAAAWLNELRRKRKVEEVVVDSAKVTQTEAILTSAVHQLEEWARTGSQTCFSRVVLIRGQMAILAGETFAALNMFRRAQKMALEVETIPIAAIAGECAVDLLEELGYRDLLEFEVAMTRRNFLNWGAVVKEQELATRFPEVKNAVVMPMPASHVLSSFGPTQTLKSSSNQLNLDSAPNASNMMQISFAALLKAAHAITSSVRFEDLALQLSSTILENVRGTRLVLLVRNAALEGIGAAAGYTSATAESLGASGAGSGSGGHDGNGSGPNNSRGRTDSISVKRRNIDGTPRSASALFRSGGGAGGPGAAGSSKRINAEAASRAARNDIRVVAVATQRSYGNIANEALDVPFDEWPNIPHRLVDSVIALAEPVAISDVMRSEYTNEPYYVTNAVASVLCFPVMHGTNVVGVVYVEHDTQRGAFAPKFLDVVSVLLANVAGALVNARLYAKLQEHTTAIETTNAFLTKTLRIREAILSNTSHELRTPLNGILGLSEVLLSSADLLPKTREQIGIINACARSLLSLVNDILDTAQLQQSQIVLNRERVHLKPLVAEVIDVTRFLVVKPVVLVNDVSPDVPPVCGDRMRIRQVLFNIIGNAVKFTPSGKVTVTSTVVPGNMVAIAIRDTGIGFPRSQTELIFEPFVQLDSAGSRRFGGSGLGLSISRALIELHGGSIKAESVEGVGSVFTVTLPLITDAKSDSESNSLSVTQNSDVMKLNLGGGRTCGSTPTGHSPGAPLSSQRRLSPSAPPMAVPPLAEDMARSAVSVQTEPASLVDQSTPSEGGDTPVSNGRRTPTRGAMAVLSPRVTADKLSATYPKPMMRRSISWQDSDSLVVPVPRRKSLAHVEQLREAPATPSGEEAQAPQLPDAPCDGGAVTAVVPGRQRPPETPVTGLDPVKEFDTIRHTPASRKNRDDVDLQSVAVAAAGLAAASAIANRDPMGHSGDQMVLPGLAFHRRLLLTPRTETARALPPDSFVAVPHRQSLERKPRVLVVDDNVVNLIVMEEMLHDQMDVVCCESAMQALELLHQRDANYDLVLLDWMMPIMDGVECCKEIRKFLSLAELPVIFLTAKSQTESVLEGFAAGASDYLTKPVDRLELLARSTALIGLRRAFEMYIPRAVRLVALEAATNATANHNGASAHAGSDPGTDTPTQAPTPSGTSSTPAVMRVCVCVRLLIHSAGRPESEDSESDHVSGDGGKSPAPQRKRASSLAEALDVPASAGSPHPRRFSVHTSATLEQSPLLTRSSAASAAAVRGSPSHASNATTAAGVLVDPGCSIALFAALLRHFEATLPAFYHLARANEAQLEVSYLVAPEAHDAGVVAAAVAQFQQEELPVHSSAWHVHVAVGCGTAESAVVAVFSGVRRRVGAVEGWCLSEAAAQAAAQAVAAMTPVNKS